MRAQASIGLDERVTSGPGATSHESGGQSGTTFMASEPYGSQTADAQRLPDGSLVIWELGSRIWVQM